MDIKVGEQIVFGRWDGEAIVWRVLDMRDSKALLISEQAIDCLEYNESCCGVTWADCSLRSWLNGGFLKGAFSWSERRRIVKTTVSTEDNVDIEHETLGGPDTVDRIFCLSIKEALSFFADEDDRICRPTQGARESGAYVYENGACNWWLRSPGESQDIAAYVMFAGIVDQGGWYVTGDYYCVRPALWLDLTRCS